MATKQYITKRGVYLDLDKSPYKFYLTDDNGIILKTYLFSSKKKQDMFYKELERKKLILQKLYGKIFTIVGEEKVFDLKPLLAKIVDNTYKNMRYK